MIGIGSGGWGQDKSLIVVRRHLLPISASDARARMQSLRRRAASCTRCTIVPVGLSVCSTFSYIVLFARSPLTVSLRPSLRWLCHIMIICCTSLPSLPLSVSSRHLCLHLVIRTLLWHLPSISRFLYICSAMLFTVLISCLRLYTSRRPILSGPNSAAMYISQIPTCALDIPSGSDVIYLRRSHSDVARVEWNESSPMGENAAADLAARSL